MDNKNDLFDLEREKRELDTFLSTIAEDEASASPSVKSAAPAKEGFSFLADSKSAFEALQQEPAGLVPELPTAKTEVSKPSGRNDKTYSSEFIPKFADVAPLGLAGDSDAGSDRISSFLSMDEGKKADALPRVTVSPAIKPLESFKTMTRFDGTMKAEERSPIEEKPLPEVKKISTDVKAEKKVDTASPYDYSPKKSIGKGKLVWILIIVIILLLAGYFGLASKSFVPSIGSLFKIEWGSSVSSVKGINLLNVRQRLVHNAKLGKSLRVVEGIAENSTSQPVSKVKVVANLYGTDGTLLASMQALGGNILMDSQLENLDEAGLISELNQGKASEDRIPPKGQIPFMIIFTKELAGVHKLSVSPIDYVKN